MKQKTLKYNWRKKAIFLKCIGLVYLFLIYSPSFSQTDSTSKTDSVPELISPSVQFISVQKADKTLELKVSIKAKNKGNVSRPSGINTKFFLVTDSGEKELGEAKTDIAGIAKVLVKEEALVLSNDGKLLFKCSTAKSRLIDEGGEELSIKRGRLELTTHKEDSTQSVTLKLVDLSTGTEKPVAETGLAVYVKRMINPLKIAEGKTDSSGVAEIEIPSNIPGDSKGNIELIARLDDNEDYGIVEASSVQSWGTKVSNVVTDLPRSLYSTHPPVWMLVTFVILVSVVWGHYVVIIYELFRLRKEH